jgi:hypothetical protein
LTEAAASTSDSEDSPPRRMKSNIRKKIIKPEDTTIAYPYDVPHLENTCWTTSTLDDAKDIGNAAINEIAASPSSASGVPAASKGLQKEDAGTTVVSADEILLACYWAATRCALRTTSPDSKPLMDFVHC